MIQPAPNSTVHCDVFIAGSGLLGCTFARLLVDRGARVLMADIGDFHSRRAGENRKNSWINQRNLVQYGHFVRGQLHPVQQARGPAIQANTGHTDYPSPLVAYAVGGMAVHWTCAIPEFHERLERPAYIDAAEWRLLYDRAAVLLNRHVDVFHRSVRHRVIKRELAEQGWSIMDTPMAAERAAGSAFVTYSGADTILGSLAEPVVQDWFRILPEHCVQRLVRSADNEHTIGHAEVLDIKTGNVFAVHANTFVVAAGWLHTAQILAKSDIHTHKGSALGRYFADHTFAACTVVLKPSVLAAIAAEARNDPQVAGNETDAWGIPASDAAPHLYLPVTDARPWQGMIFRESFQFDPLPGGVEDLRGIDLKWFGTIDPVRANGVIFHRDQQDAFGMPRPSFHMRLGEKDADVQRRMLLDMQAVAAHLGPYRTGAEPGFAPLGAAIHGAGLTRMGPQDDQGRTSVVDPFCRVWGLDNLILAGTSVIPTPSAANPTLTAVALAIRAADAAAGCIQVR